VVLDIKYIFDDAESRIEGLRGHRCPIDACALFVYETPAPRKFWMKGVHTNLYLSAVLDNEVVGSIFMRANTTEVHIVSEPVMVVVESRVEIPVGSHVDIVGEKLVVSNG